MKSSRRKTIFLKLIVFLVVLYGVSLLALYFSQRSFMYHPDLGDENSFLARAEASELMPWRDANGNLIGWKRLPKKTAKKRMLILHGNGGSALSRTYMMDGFDKSGDWEFYALEYPGYGWRAGASTETAILNAAEAALKELSAGTTPVFLAGESLGTGVACLLAARMPKAVSGLFLVTPYTSTSDVAAGRFPFFPVRFLMHDRYEAAAALREYSGPVAILLAGNDYIVPTRFGKALFDGYDGPKKFWIQPEAGHNSLDFSPDLKLWREVEHFWQQHSSQNDR